MIEFLVVVGFGICAFSSYKLGHSDGKHLGVLATIKVFSSHGCPMPESMVKEMENTS